MDFQRLPARFVSQPESAAGTGDRAESAAPRRCPKLSGQNKSLAPVSIGQDTPRFASARTCRANRPSLKSKRWKPGSKSRRWIIMRTVCFLQNASGSCRGQSVHRASGLGPGPQAHSGWNWDNGWPRTNQDRVGLSGSSYMASKLDHRQARYMP